MKILIVHNEYQNRGGEDCVVAAESRLLANAGHEIVYYGRTNHEIGHPSLIQAASLASNAIWSRDSYRAIRELIIRERPDVAHFHNTFPLISPSAYSACRDSGVPVVQTLHNYRLLCPRADLLRDGRLCEDCVGKWSSWPGVVHACYRESRAATSAVAAMLAVHRTLGTWQKKVDVYIALSEFARRKFLEGGLPDHKIVVKGNFVEKSNCVDSGLRPAEEYGIYVGRLAPEKGLRQLLEAWKASGASLRLRIVGDGPLRAQLELDRQNLDLPNVEFAGHLDHERALDAVQHARFLALPSQCYEAFPMVIAEAYACGVPVIAANHGAMAEMVEDGRTGLLFAPGNSQDLAAKIRLACTEAARLAEMGIAARAKFDREYAAESNLARLLSIYERAIAVAKSRSVRTRATVAVSPTLSTEGVAAPRKTFDVLGVDVSAVQIPDMIDEMKRWIRERKSCHAIAVTGMHGVMEAQHDRKFKDFLNAADAVVPDGMPLVWLGRLRGLGLKRRVYGPELMFTFCKQTAKEGYRHFFYGGAAGVAERLSRILQIEFPGLQVAGIYSPPFRQLTQAEDDAIVAKINDAATDVVWVGLGTPKQEIWMLEHRDKLRAPVVVSVGAAFDIHSGAKSQAPAWMREHGLEWLFRLAQEPTRLWRRYLVYGSEFVFRVCLELIGAGRKEPAR
jgi:exopolysaccharide biosynthesis WecB/TagA/CpsF family protein